MRMPYGVELVIFRSGVGERKRCLTAVGIAGDVDGVGLVLDEIEAAEESRVEQCGCELGNATAHVAGEAAVVDHAGLDETLGRRTFADVVVDREGFARSDDRAAYEVRDAVDVLYARFATGMRRGERGHRLVDVHLLRPRGVVFWGRHREIEGHVGLTVAERIDHARRAVRRTTLRPVAARGVRHRSVGLHEPAELNRRDADGTDRLRDVLGRLSRIHSEYEPGAIGAGHRADPRS